MNGMRIPFRSLLCALALVGGVVAGALAQSTPQPPQILLAGFDTMAMAPSTNNAFTAQALVEGDVRTVELTFAGAGMGLFLVDDGTSGDAIPGDGLWSLALEAGTLVPPNRYLLGLKASGPAGTATWPEVKVPVASPPPDFSALNAYIDQVAPAFDGNLLVVAEWQGQPFFERQVGDIARDSEILMASATKWIAAGVMLRLADAGLLNLDQRIGDVVSVFDRYGKGDFTCRHAFAMSSGLYGAPNYERLEGLTLQQSTFLIAADKNMVFTPGTQMAYDGAGMQSWGYAATQLLGQEWETIAEERLFTPLGMTSATWDLRQTNPVVPGGLRLHANDYLTFLRMIFNDGLHQGQRILSPASIDAFFTDHNEVANGAPVPIYSTPWPRDMGDLLPYDNLDTPPYGFGTWILAKHPTTNVVEEVTSPGAYGCFPFYDRTRDLYGVIFTQMPPTFLTNNPAYYTTILDLLQAAVDGV